MEFILTNVTQVHVAHQASPYVLSILVHLTKSFLLLIIEFILKLVVAILAMPHSYQ